jgi:hypothetical protein
MIERHQQLFRHDPENGVYGDCFRTVIACLMRLKPEEVPHVVGPGTTSDVSNSAMRKFLSAHGFVLLEIAFPGEMPLADALHLGGVLSHGMHWILSGRSRNGCNHVVICKEAEIVHDTSIDQSGIVGPTDVDQWWIGWLVRPAPCDEGVS